MKNNKELNKLLGDFNQAFYDRGWKQLAPEANVVEFKNNTNKELFTISRHFFINNKCTKALHISNQYPVFPKATDCECLEVLIMELIKVYKEDWFKEYTRKINKESTSYPAFITNYKEYFKKDGVYFYFFEAHNLEQKFIKAIKYKIVFQEIENGYNGEMDKLEVLVYHMDDSGVFDQMKSYYYDITKYIIGVDIAI